MATSNRRGTSAYDPLKRKDMLTGASHKVIEKRRRDRINHCLYELTQCVPPAFMKQNGGKLEKAEILEMTVEYLKSLRFTENTSKLNKGSWERSDIQSDFIKHYEQGFTECMREAAHFLTDREGLSPSHHRCVRLLTFLSSRLRPHAPSPHPHVTADAYTRPEAFRPHAPDPVLGSRLHGNEFAQMGMRASGFVHAYNPVINRDDKPYPYKRNSYYPTRRTREIDINCTKVRGSYSFRNFTYSIDR